MAFSPMLAQFVWPPPPLRGQRRRPGKAGSVAFLE